MLITLLENTKTQINPLEPKRDAHVLLKQITASRPDFVESMRLWLSQHQGGSDQEAAELFALLNAGALVFGIKKIPSIMQVLAARLLNPSIDASVRCTIGGLLVYLVQPRDLIPDDAPGGYGFVDDYALLLSGLLQLNVCTELQDQPDMMQNMLNLISKVIPIHLLEPMQAMINGVSQGLQLLNVLPPEFLEVTIQKMIQNPLQLPVFPQPSNFMPAPGPSLERGHWSGGAYFEGNNVIMTGGPALIDGQLFIPDN